MWELIIPLLLYAAPYSDPPPHQLVRYPYATRAECEAARQHLLERLAWTPHQLHGEHGPIATALLDPSTDQPAGVDPAWAYADLETVGVCQRALTPIG